MERLFFNLLLLVVYCSVSIASTCTWCENGNDSCNGTFSEYKQSIFTTTISSLLDDRGFPYFHPSSQSPIDAETETDSNSLITMAIIVHHGSGRNAEDYCSYMTNSVLMNGRSLTDTLIIAPQVYEKGDEGLDRTTMLWWQDEDDDGVDLNGGERDWKWGGNSTRDLPYSISTFSVLDEMLLTLADKDRFPNLQKVVFAGHSAGE